MGTWYNVVDQGRDREAWLLARKDGVGASEAAAVLGLSSYASPLSVFADKSNPLEADEIPPSALAVFGQRYERQIALDFGVLTGREVQMDGRLLAGKKRPWQRCTLDAVQTAPERHDRGLLEIKSSWMDWENDPEYPVPEQYYAQVQHQFAVTGFSWGSIAVFNRISCQILWADVKPDPFYIGVLEEAEKAFWEDTLNGVAPPPDGSDATRAALRRLYPKHVDAKFVPLTAGLQDQGTRLQVIKAEIKEREAEKRGLENEIIAAIGDAEGGIFPSGEGYTYKTQHRKESTTPAGSFRVLRKKDSF